MEHRHTVWPEAQMVYTSNGKVAGTSIKTAFLQTFTPDAPRKSPHSADQQYINVRNQREIASLYPTYLHVAGVRDPYDRMVSFYTDKIEGTINGSGMNARLQKLGFRRPMTFAETVEVACSIPDDETDPHLRSQGSNVLGATGELIPDLVLRFEQLEADWALLTHIVATRTGVHLAPLGRRRVSVRGERDDYYDDQTRALVAERYRRDFEALGYPIEPTTPDPVDGPDLDPLWAARRDRAASTVLDLSAADRGLAESTRHRGGHYLAPLRFGAPGQLNRLDAFVRGHIPESAFDILVVTSSQAAQSRSHFSWLDEQFRSTGRTVVVTRDSAATEAWNAPLTATAGTTVSSLPIVGPVQRAVHRYGWREAVRRVPQALERRVRSRLHRDGDPGTRAGERPASPPADARLML